MSIQEVSAEQLAERFYDYDHALRADHDHAGERDTEAWEEIPHQERSRLVACRPFDIGGFELNGGRARKREALFCEAG